MAGKERLPSLIAELLKENPAYGDSPIPVDERGQWRLFRSLCNLRPPRPASPDFLQMQDSYLREALLKRGITD